MTTRTIVFEAEIDGKKFKAHLQELKKGADKAFDGGTKGAKGLGVQIGITSGIASGLVNVFSSVARNATDAIRSIINEAVELNKEAELTKISVTNIFGGNEKVADAFLERVKEVSVLLGADRQELTGLAKGILPDIGSTDTTLDFLQAITILGRDAGQSMASIRIAAEEALSGNLSSLTRRLNIPKSVTNSINEYAKEMSFADAVTKALQERVEVTGLSAESMANSLTVVQGQLESQIQDLKKSLGEPIAEQLKEEFAEIGDLLTENEPAIADFTIALGQLAARIIEIVSTDIQEFIGGLDFEQLSMLADDLNVVVTRFDAFFGLINSNAKSVEEADSTMSQLSATMDELNTIATAATQIFGILDAFISGGVASISNVATLTQYKLGLISAEEAAEGFIDVEKTMLDALNDANDAIAQGDKQERELAENRKERAKGTEKATEAEIKAAEELLASGVSEKDNAEELAAAKEKVAEATDKLNKAREEGKLDLQIKQERRLTDELLDNARAREDLARDNAQSIEDINRKAQQAIADEVKEIASEEQKIAKDGAKRQAEIARSEADEKVGIERDYRRQLERIRDDFNQSALEAERNNDVQAFLQAQRTRDSAIDDATTTRDNSIEDAKANAQQQREALKTELEAEIADAREANQTKLEDLRARLASELEEQRIKNEREYEDQAIAEARKEADRITRNEREIADFELQQQRKLDALQTSLKAEYDLIAASETAKTELIVSEEEKRRKARETKRKKLQSAFVKANDDGIGSVDSSIRLPSNTASLPVFHNEGFTRKGETSIVKSGEKLFTAPKDGFIGFNQPQLYSPPALPQLGGMNNSNNTTTNNNNAFQLSQSMFDDPVQRRQLESFILRVMS